MFSVPIAPVKLLTSSRLHKEVVDFYEYVRPRQFEQRIRDQLVDNLRKAMKRDGRNFATASVHPFGSFMSGLYLPTADMDLVVCSASFMRGGLPIYTTSKNQLYKFKRFLETQYVADGHSIQVIAHARVPLVKYVDKTTGLRVDVSFENMGGVGAVDTFLDWKKRYPAMPILVTVIKHFLLMRGLNEPVNGGIGGFSVICLVVSMLQLMPQVQSRSMIPEHHLGEMLLEFMDLYGRRFRYDNVAIRLTGSPGYVRKVRFTSRQRVSSEGYTACSPLLTLCCISLKFFHSRIVTWTASRSSTPATPTTISLVAHLTHPSSSPVLRIVITHYDNGWNRSARSPTSAKTAAFST